MRSWSNAVLLSLALATALCGQEAATPSTAPNSPRVVHVIVALADNQYQGIVPVPRAIGNGDDPANNLYWGCEAGVKTWFRKSEDWKQLGKCHPGKYPVLERCIFKHKQGDVYLVADAYRGRELKTAIARFFSFASGKQSESVQLEGGASILAGGSADLISYIGHDGLMDFRLDRYEYWADNKHRDAIILACASKQYFADALRWTGAKPLLWTTNLMAPEAYTLEAALKAWVGGEDTEQLRARAASAYHKYQHCGLKAARNLLVTGW